eukprot:9141285-Pyramimonas_sp.AAC.1
MASIFLGCANGALLEPLAPYVIRFMIVHVVSRHATGTSTAPDDAHKDADDILKRLGIESTRLGEHGMPLRGAWGAMPGPIQTVGCADRVALLQALRLLPKVALVVTDLLSIHDE